MFLKFIERTVDKIQMAQIIMKEDSGLRTQDSGLRTQDSGSILLSKFIDSATTVAMKRNTPA